MNETNHAFSRYSWIVTGYTILVIVWGAFVRATGSGAGCGNHWPSCNGQIIPRPEEIATWIEFSHRISSSLSGLLVLIMLIWAWRRFAAGSRIRQAAAIAFFLILVEGAIGAMLVRLELVEDNASMLRAIVIAIHLANTLLLLAALALTSWWSAGHNGRFRSARRTLLFIGLTAFVLLSGAGAVTALGDTLFPAESLASGLAQDLDPLAHFLIRLRFWHPLLAIIVSAYWLYLARSGGQRNRFSRAIQLLILLQVGGGILNIVLLAPVWMQLFHLLLADLLWLSLLLFAVED